MMHDVRANLYGISRGQFDPELPTGLIRATSCACSGATVRKLLDLCPADKSTPSGRHTGPESETKEADCAHLTEDEILELAIRLLAETCIASNLSASMRLIEHIAENAGYRRAQQSTSTNVTELMLMAARASALADDFRQDP